MEALASATGLSVNTIRNAERGAPPNLANLIAIATALDIGVGELLGEGVPTGAERLTALLPLADDLEDSDIETLTIVAKQLVSARRSAASTASTGRSDTPPGQLTEGEREVQRSARALADRAGRLNAAEDPGTYDADRSRDGGRGAGRNPGA